MKAIIRENMVVNHVGSVAIIIGHPNGFSKERNNQASMLCVTCDALMNWSEDECMFSCPTCEYDMTPDEAVELCNVHMKKIKALRSHIPGYRTFWQKFLGR